MLFSRAVLTSCPWHAYGLVEDAEYGAALARRGVRVRFRADVVVTAEVPADGATLARQRARWGAAVWSGGWAGFPGRSLASKPLVLTHLAATTVVTAVCAAGTSAGWAAGLVGCLTGVWVLTAAVYGTALTYVGGWRRLVPAAGLAARLAGVTLAGAVTRPGTWHRTRRAGEG